MEDAAISLGQKTEEVKPIKRVIATLQIYCDEEKMSEYKASSLKEQSDTQIEFENEFGVSLLIKGSGLKKCIKVIRSEPKK